MFVSVFANKRHESDLIEVEKRERERKLAWVFVRDVGVLRSVVVGTSLLAGGSDAVGCAVVQCAEVAEITLDVVVSVTKVITNAHNTNGDTLITSYLSIQL